MPPPTRDRNVPAKSAEAQMRRWAIGLEVQNRLEHDRAIAEIPDQIHPYLAISREAGTGATDMARQMSDELGWQLVGLKLLDDMAEHYKLPKDMLRFVDETTSSWLYEAFGKWLNRHLVTQSEYVGRLGRIVLMAARHASSVFVGRGAQFLLPREKGLTVRVLAPLTYRVQRVMERRHLGRDEATRYVKHLDRGRREFVQKYFHRDAEDPRLYDVVVNLEHMGPEGAAELILRQCRARFT